MTGLETLAVFAIFLVPLAFLFCLAARAVDDREKRRAQPVNDDRLLGALRRRGGA